MSLKRMSLLLSLLLAATLSACGGGGSEEGGAKDAGPETDTGGPVEDAGEKPDTGGTPDTGGQDAGADTGPADTGPADTGPADAGPTETAEQEPNGFDPAAFEWVYQDITPPVVIDGNIDAPTDTTDPNTGDPLTIPDYDGFQFAAKAGEYVRVELVAKDQLDPVVMVVDPETRGSIFFRGAYLTAEKTSAMSVFIPADGPYVIIVSDYNNLGDYPLNVGGAGYEYTLTVTYAGFTPTALGPLPHHDAHQMKVDEPDFFAHTPAGKELLQIETFAGRLPTPSPLDTVVTLFDAAGKAVLATHDNIDAYVDPPILDSFLRAYTAGAGEHLIIVEAALYTQQATDYELDVSGLPPDKEAEPNDGFDTAFPFPFPGTIDGFIDVARDGVDEYGDPIKIPDIDLYWFDGKAGDFVTFRIEAEGKTPASPLDSFVGIYQVVDTILGPYPVIIGLNNNSDGLDSRADALLPEDGKYYVLVADSRNTQDNPDPVGGTEYVYTLKGEKGTLVAQTASSLPFVKTEAVDPGGTYKFYKFPVKKGQRVTLSVATAAGANAAFFPYFTLYAPDFHTPIDATGDGVETAIVLERVFVEDATYMIGISDYAGEGGPDYKFDLSITAVDIPSIEETEPNDDIAHAMLLDKNPELAFGTLDGDAQTDMADVYKFTAVVGQMLTARLSGGAAPDVSDTILRILDDTGAELASNDDFGSNYYSAFEKWPIPYDGTFYLSVEPQIDYGPVAGSYVLEFMLETCTPGAAAPVVGNLVLNEILADVPAGAVGDANGDGTTDAAEDQFVEVVNVSGRELDLSTLSLHDATKAVHKFACGTLLPLDGVLLVFGGGAPADTFGGAVLVVSKGLELTPAGDTVSIKDGATTVVGHTFGTEADDGQSITRDPDITGNFVKHSTAAGAGGALFSPGVRANGLPFGIKGTPAAEVEPNNDRAHATALPALPAAAKGTLKFWETAGDDLEDWFSFAGTAGQKLTVRTYPGPSPDITDTKLALYDANGNALSAGAKDDIDFGNWYSEIVDFVLPASGTYFVQVMAEEAYGNIPPGGDEPGSYICDVFVTP